MLNKRDMSGITDEIKKNIDKCKILSLDFYDTLFFRDVEQPTDVFQLVEDEYNKKNDVRIQDFKEIRTAAEKNVRNNKTSEISINEIYNEMNNSFSEMQLKQLLTIEINIEKKIVIVNPRILEIIRYAKLKNKLVVITSDYYIGSKFIREILDSNKISYDEIFVSCDYKKTKLAGDLYECVRDKMKCTYNQMIHIGDNSYSDFVNANKKGIIAYHYQKSNCNSMYFKTKYNNLYDGYLAKFILNRYDLFNNREEQLGYAIFGPLLYGFCVWLKNELNINNISRVYFLSRDGLIIKKAFEKIYKESDICKMYFLTSRRALQVPAIDSSDYSELCNKINFPKQISYGTFLKKVGMDKAWIDEFCKKNNINKNKEVSVFGPEIKYIYENAFDTIKNNANIEKRNFFQYAQIQKMTGKCAIVDIGWYGNMQKNLQDLLGNRADIHGFYIALDPRNSNQKNNNMSGYLFDKMHNQNLKNYEDRFNDLFESIFTANHGSVIKYDKDGKVILAKNEHSLNGDWRVIGGFQKGALKFVDDYLKSGLINTINRKFIIDNMFSMFLNPTVPDAYMWSDVGFLDSEYSKINNIKEKKYYLKNLSEIITDYKKSKWKIGFMTIFFGCRINFLFFINITEKLKNMLKKNK